MPHLRVIRSNRIELLARYLGAVVRDNLPADPMARIDIVVGSRGMDRWLRHALADQPALAICSNFEFPFPAAKIDELVAKVIGPQQPPAVHPFDEKRKTPPDAWGPDTLMWALLDVLPELVDTQGFELVRKFLQDPAAWNGPADARQIGLARQLAEVFDRYVAYRPELALAWSDDSHVPELETWTPEWQRPLWLAVERRLRGKHHRARRITLATEALRSSGHIDGVDAPLFVFGVSSLPPSWMGLIGALARHVEVDLFLLCPSPVYWAELHRAASTDGARFTSMDRNELAEELGDLQEEAAHPLLASMGRVARDFQLILEAQPDHFVTDQLDTFPDPAEGKNGGQALQWLQSDLLAARHPGHAMVERVRDLSPDDDSVQFHSCHGPMRQVEVLRNLLLGLLEDHPRLESRHIVVMTPDIETYAPLITAVFSQGPQHRLERDGAPVFGPEGWGDAGAPAIPFEIVDLSIRRINPVADALVRVLELVDGRMPASAVVDLLTLEPVRLRFHLEAEDIPTLQGWIEDSGIRWARDAEHRAAEGQPADVQNTWQFGLRRLLLGVVMADDGGMLVADDTPDGPTNVRPFDDIEGGETLLLGRLVDFCNTLFDLTDLLRAPRTVAAWVDALYLVLDRMTGTTSTSAWLNVRVRETLADLVASANEAASVREVGLDAIRSALSGRFDVPSRLTREQSGAVTFCAMRPMRSVPYEVVCLLGMDENAFPRKSVSLAFDITGAHPRVGDMDPRDEDRFLLLEAILAARAHLLVLYTGRDPRTNETSPPCVPVGELRDLLDQTARPPAQASSVSAFVTTEHPLQSFSPSAFDPVGARGPAALRRRWSFDRRLLASAEARSRKLGERTPFLEAAAIAPAGTQSQEEVALEDMIRFFRHPAKHLLQRRLKVNLDDHAEAIPDREPIELDHLERWSLRHALLDGAKSASARVIRQLRASGSLPLGYAGKVTVEHQAELVQAMFDETGLSPEDLTSGEPIAVDVSVGGVRLKGSIPCPVAGLLFSFQFQGESGEKLVGPWLSLLAWHLMRQDAGRAVVLFAKHEKGAPKVTLLGFEPPPNPRALLGRLVEIYVRGNREPIPLFPHASSQFARDLAALSGDASLLDDGLPTEPAILSQIREAHRAAQAVWRGSYIAAESADRYHARLFEGTCPLDDPDESPIPLSLDFARLSLDVFGPISAARETSKLVRTWLPGGA